MVRYGEVKHLFRFVLAVFGKLKLDKTQKKKLVGIVGEIYVKFSPLGNNRLEEFLLSEGCEPVLPGLMDFCLYCIYNSVIDHELYSRNGKNRRRLQDGVPVCTRQAGRYHQNDEERRSFPSADAV